jgi:hypothetical protein
MHSKFSILLCSKLIFYILTSEFEGLSPTLENLIPLETLISPFTVGQLILLSNTTSWSPTVHITHHLALHHLARLLAMVVRTISTQHSVSTNPPSRELPPSISTGRFAQRSESAELSPRPTTLQHGRHLDLKWVLITI